MSEFAVIAPPLQDVRETIWTRLTTDGNTSGYTFMREGHPAEMPYLALGPTYKGAGSGDIEMVANIVTQIDAYAAAKAGGSNKVSEMIEAVYAAISAGALTFGSTAPFETVVEDDVLNSNLLDASNELYAQRFVRFRFIITV